MGSRKIEILILGANDRASLAVLRSLGKHSNLKVSLIYWGEKLPVHYSKHLSKSHLVANPLYDLPVFEKDLAKFIQDSDDDPYIIPINDLTTEIIYSNYDFWAKLGTILGPSPESYFRAKNKLEMMELSWKLGLGKVSTDRISTLNVTKDIKLQFPYYVKPVSSVHRIDEQIFTSSVKKVENENQLDDFLRDHIAVQDVICQEPISGHGIGVNVISQNGQLIAASINERVHEPANGGASSFRRSIPISDELLEIASAFARELNWTGVMMIELKKDYLGKFYLMEINPRFWGSLQLSIWAGIDFPLLFLNIYLDHTILSEINFTPYKYSRHLKRDIKWLKSSLKRNKFNPFYIFKWLFSWRHFLFGKELLDVEWLSDLGPAYYEWITSRKRKEPVKPDRQEFLLKKIKSDLKDLNHLFVCKGNINRSPFAEFYLNKQSFNVQSSSTLARAGRYAGRKTELLALDKYSIDLSTHRSKPISSKLVDWADIIWIFDKQNYKSLLSMPFIEQDKIRLLAGYGKKEYEWIQDPYGKNDGDFEECLELISKHLNRVFL